MKNSKKNHGAAGQSRAIEKTSNKHDANLQKNSSLYFQIGLILCLLATYGLFEMQFQDKKLVPLSVDSNELAVIDVAPTYRIEVIKKEVPKPVQDKPTTKLIDRLKEVENDSDITESKIVSNETPKHDESPYKIGDLTDFDDPDDEEVFVPFTAVEKAPVFPGCEKFESNNTKLKKCMSKKISKLINKRFNTGLGSKYGMSGKLKISTQFTIDHQGNVTDIKTRGPHPKLEQEADRVINKIPQMRPGYQRDKPVGVIYTLPITFYVQ